MEEEAPKLEIVEFQSPEGRVLAKVKIEVAGRTGNEHTYSAPLSTISVDEILEWGEARIQLREHGRYRYEIIDGPDDLALREIHEVIPDSNPKRGAIEPGDHCGRLILEIVGGNNPDAPIARGEVEVRSLKVGYREHYRGMLDEIARRNSALLVDSRISTRVQFEGAANEQAFLEQQFEFLRNLICGRRFRGALELILRAPHRQLREIKVEQSIRKPLRTGRDLVRQITRGRNRIELPNTHPLSKRLPSLPETVLKTVRIDNLDTPENRFIKMALEEFRDTLLQIETALGSERESKDRDRLLKEANHLGKQLDDVLRRGFFPELSRPTMVPHGSTTLQRKEGYRQIYLDWLQFHAAGVLRWDGGDHVYGAGTRNVATLYEYWLFFQLEALFRKKFKCDQPLHDILVSKETGLPRLRLKSGISLEAPIEGFYSHAARRLLRAEFQFNKKFSPKKEPDPSKEGTWTLGARPDYTFTIWPAEFEKQQAEANELLVHIHFDAKYRVENLEELIGSREGSSISGKTSDGAKRPQAKYDDLLKMHAYRDAIRRTAGAYVLYPGDPSERDGRFSRFHEIIPGLGAFPVCPNQDGEAIGMDSVSTFLDQVLEHLSNRTTARERLSYHVSETYKREEAPIQYGETILAETDLYGADSRALPPAEHIVVVAWHQTPKQLAWTKEKGLANVRLGKDRPGSLHVLPEISSARHLMLRTHGAKTHEGLWKLTKPGFKVYTAEELRDTGYPEPTNSEIYAVFEVETDEDWEQAKWADKKIVEAIEEFEARRQDRLGFRLGRTSPKPRFISLKRLLEALNP
jgi:predicted component of viral defense system (DUF524 family)